LGGLESGPFWPVKGLLVTATLIVLAVVIVVLVVSVLIHNGLVRRRNQVDNAWSQIDVQLKRRYDLIPNLVETVKGYASHERGTLEAVTEARAQAISAQGPADQAAAENVLTGALKSLFAVAESYPDLRASQNFLELQQELSATEDRAAYARQYYNDAVLTYNNAVTTVPQNLFAAIFRFRTREYFQAGGEERGPVQVRF
jgi:LemA protein